MTELLNSLSPAALLAVTLLAKVTLILLAAGLVSAALRQVSAGVRHLVWSAALVAIIALPLMTVMAPWKWNVGLLPALSQSASQPLTQAEPSNSRNPGTVSTALSGSVANAGRSEPSPALMVPQEESTRWSLREKLLAIWLFGAALVAARLALGSFLVSRMVRSATPLHDADWQGPLMDVADRLQLPQIPGLFLSNRLPMPFACGLFRAAIVLPAEAGEWTEKRRQAVLCHELAHLRRKDLAINVLAQCALAIYWFHPLVWVAVRRLRIESERACDDLVLGTGTRASEYADHLLEIVRAVPRSPLPVAVLPFADRGEFEGRVLAILERGARREPASRKGAVTVLSLGLLLLAPLAVMVPVRRTAPPAEQWSSQMMLPTPRPSAKPAPTQAPAQRPQPKSPALVITDTALVVTENAVVSTSTRTSTSLHSEPSDTGDGRLVVRSLIDALTDTVASVRENAAYSLGRLRASSAAPTLARMVERDPSASAREMSAWALGNIRSADANSSLGTAVQRDSSASVRATAVWALAQSDSPSALPGLTAALRDKSAEVRGRAAWAIGSIRPETAPALLIETATDSSPSVRQRAAWALGQIRDASAVPALSRLVQDTSSDVREAALWALGNMEGEAAETALVKAMQTSDPAMRAQAARALGGGHGHPWPWPWPMPR